MVSTALLVTLLAQAPVTPQATQPATPTPHGGATAVAAYVPQRVYDTRRKAFTDFETMLADLARADVVFVGEQHDDPNTHRLESAILQGLMRRQVPVTVSLEMFERDVQGLLDQYLAGQISEEEFLKASRPWPRYMTDYRVLVEMAKGHGWKVIAANVPRRLAADVSKGGQAAYDAAKGDDRALMAADLQCPKDEYFNRFSQQMGEHPAAGTKPAAKDAAAPSKEVPKEAAKEPAKDPAAEAKAAEDKRATVDRYYLSQCLKDETMAEAIVAAFTKQAGRPGTIVHYNGAFHSDYGLGTAERVRRRLPGRRIAVVTMLPVENLDTVSPEGDTLKVADYVVYTIK